MGLFNWLLQLVGWQSKPPATRPHTPKPPPGPTVDQSERRSATETHEPARQKSPRKKARLTPTRRRELKSTLRHPLSYVETQGKPPYRYARYGSQTGHYLDLSRDGDENRLAKFKLPIFHTPEQLAEWLGIPLNKIAWLVHRFSGGRPTSEDDAHYHFHWVKKKRGGWRLIEAPKALLKLVQTKILHDLLDQVPAHSSAHGFAIGRSILTNAKPHVGKEVLLKLDLQNFYTTVNFARVVAIFRSLGYSREVSIWLGLLTTSSVPGNLAFQEQGPYALLPYFRRHLPQGAPTSPALANLSAFGMDVRLAGLAQSFGGTYTRYADDIVVSGPAEFGYGLRIVIPLAQKIINQERFVVNYSKRRILRSHQRQTVTGVVVNEKPNISRAEFDRLKAILTNCLRYGPSTQNRGCYDDYYQHLRGCIAHVSMLNPARGQKLMNLFQSVDWTK